MTDKADEVGSHEFAAAVGWSHRTTLRRCEQGAVPGAYRNGRTGREWRIPRESIAEIRRQQAVAAQKAKEGEQS